VALLSYTLGRHWVGGQLEKTLLGRVPLKTQTDSGAPGAATGDGEALPPSQVKVESEPRQPTDAEKNDISSQELSQSGEGGGAVTAEGSSAPTPAPAATDATASGAGYTVTAGSYSSSSAAQKAVNDLESRGYSPHLTEFQRHGSTYYRVVVGIYGDHDRAEAVRQELESAGYAAGIIAP
jgi:cell division protein FtsN